MTSAIGPVILDLEGYELSQDEREMLQHPLVAGVILFTRNFANVKQLIELCLQIRKCRKHPLLITVDHEGGRVQRFRDGFSAIPAMGEIGLKYENHPQAALKLAASYGWLMASELLAVGVDLSFAPVLDLNKGICPTIGDRAFHSSPDQVSELAKSFIAGMKKAGMAATIKHFPGHGSVAIDSHLAIPTDSRSYHAIYDEDLQPFIQLIQAEVQAVMPAHIVFEQIDNQPVGFSSVWLRDILRTKLHFSGVIISDDLNMKAADHAGDYAMRAETALQAGCDIVLICNNRAGAIHILDKLPQQWQLTEEKFRLLQGNCQYEYNELKQSRMWKEATNID